MKCNYCDFQHAQEKTLCELCGVFNGVAPPVQSYIEEQSSSSSDSSDSEVEDFVDEKQQREAEVSSVIHAACRYMALLCNASRRKVERFVASHVDTTAMALVLTVDSHGAAEYTLHHPRVMSALILLLVSAYKDTVPVWVKPDTGLLFEYGTNAVIIDRVLGSFASASPPSLRLRAAVIALKMIYTYTESHLFTLDVQKKMCTAMKAQINTYVPSLQGTCVDALGFTFLSIDKRGEDESACCFDSVVDLFEKKHFEARRHCVALFGDLCVLNHLQCEKHDSSHTRCIANSLLRKRFGARVKLDAKTLKNMSSCPLTHLDYLCAKIDAARSSCH
jgi:hypothetical protein